MHIKIIKGKKSFYHTFHDYIFIKNKFDIIKFYFIISDLSAKSRKTLIHLLNELGFLFI